MLHSYIRAAKTMILELPKQDGKQSSYSWDLPPVSCPSDSYAYFHDTHAGTVTLCPTTFTSSRCGDVNLNIDFFLLLIFKLLVANKEILIATTM